MTGPAAPDPLFVALQTALAGRYSLDRELGRGGMGVVYLAREVQLDRLVAIKVLPPELATQSGLRDRFLREARLAAKLSHPHIIPIHAVDASDDLVYFVMTFVDGETLAQRVQRRGPVSAADASRWLREVAWALSHAHAQGVVHHDVKPDNILIEHASGRALVADFGIAAAAADAQHVITPSSEAPAPLVCGTPEFMSPEQVLGATPDARSDLYALGVTAFYALSGRVPFTGATATEILARHVTDPAPSLVGVGLAVPRRLAQLVARCLAKDPAERPPHAQALADAFGEAIEQRRELPVALRAFVKNNGRTNGGGTVLTLLGALAGSIGAAALAGPAAGVVTLVGSLVAASATFGILAAKRMLDLGFTQQDLAPAFRAEAETVREERALHPQRVMRFVERAAGALWRVLSATTAALLPFALAGAFVSRFAVVQPLFFIALAGTVLTTLAWLGAVQLCRDVDVEFWNSVWTGRAGQGAFAAARRWRGNAPIGPAMTHRATELSLSLATEQLYASLPKVTRDALKEFPHVLHQLQIDAQTLRARAEQVMPDARADVQHRLSATIAAMESLRLGLLRLHAGAATVEGLTTHIGLAADVSADVQRLIAAQQEVHDALQYPHALELTPV